MNKKEKEREEAIKELREILKPSDTLYTILRHVSRSGMMRHISVIFIKDSEKLTLDYKVAKALGWKLAKYNGIKVQGCGMDMGFHLVYSLSATIFPDGFDCVGPKCPSNDHINRVDRKHHPSGGYALRQRWL